MIPMLSDRVRCVDRLGSCIDSLERTFALNLAALTLFLVANFVLFLHMSLFQSANLCGVERQA